MVDYQKQTSSFLHDTDTTVYFLPAIVSWRKAKRLSHMSFGFMSSQRLCDPSEQVLPYAHQSET